MTPLSAIVISSGGLLHALVWLLVVAVVFWILWVLIGLVTHPQINKILRVVWYVLVAIVVINFLLGLVGEPFIRI